MSKDEVTIKTSAKVIMYALLWLVGGFIGFQFDRGVSRETPPDAWSGPTTSESNRLLLEIKLLRKDIEAMQDDVDLVRSSQRQLERQIHPACVDGSKEETRGIPAQSGQGKRLLTDFNWYGILQRREDVEAGLYHTDADEYNRWTVVTCEEAFDRFSG